MEKKRNKSLKKEKTSSFKNKETTKIPSTGKKVIVGEDEFCPTCMEWRGYDEATGKCMVCGSLIKKTSIRSRIITEEYDLKDFSDEQDESQDTVEY